MHRFFKIPEVKHFCSDMLQIVSLLTMEPPDSFSVEDLCNEKACVTSYNFPC